MKKSIKYLFVSLGVVTLAAFHSTGAFVPASQGTGLVGVVGNWSNVNDGGPAFKVDTAGWNGRTERAALEALSKSLFTTQSDTFFTNGMAPAAFPLAIHTATRDFSRGTIRVQFKLVGGTTDRTAGIAFNIKPNGEYFFARYNTLDGNVALWRYRNGARERIAQGTEHAQLPLNSWHELVMTIAGDKFTASVSGTALKLDLTLTEPVAGRVGLWTKRDAVTVFRNYTVTP